MRQFSLRVVLVSDTTVCDVGHRKARLQYRSTYMQSARLIGTALER
jgi:hypothetical protein